MLDQIHVPSETGALKWVLARRPDAGITSISPRLAGEPPFDDIVRFPKRPEENDTFSQFLPAFIIKESAVDILGLNLPTHSGVRIFVERGEMIRNGKYLLFGCAELATAHDLLTLPCTELSRRRDDSHCMTCSIRRA